MDELIYKVFRQDEWVAFAAAGRFDGSAADRHDGYIHFSTLAQLPGTLSRYYSDEDRVAIVSFRTDGFDQALKWEVSRGGDNFPHLYAALSMAQVGDMEWVDPKLPYAPSGEPPATA